MANQRIDQLNAETTPAAADVLPIYSIAGSDTKKITVKNLVQQGAALVDDASIPVAKVNLSGISGTNLTNGTVTAAKLDTSTIPATGGVTVSSSNLQLVAPTSPIVRNASTGSLEHAASGVTAGEYTKVTVDVKGHVTLGASLAAADLPVATSSVKGAVLPGTGLSVTGGGVLNHTNAATAGTTSGITFDAQGHISGIVALAGADLPFATSSVRGAMRPGTGLTVDGSGIVNLSAATNAVLGGVIVGSDFSVSTGTISLATQAGVTAGTYTKVTLNDKGISTAGTVLSAGDIPNLDAAKITTGSLDIARIAANTVTGAKLANYAVAKIGDTTPTADYISQFFFNPISRDLAMWDGNVYQPIGISIGEIIFAGTFDASTGSGTGLIASVTAEGTAIGLAIGQALPAAAAGNSRYYLVVSEAGTITTGNAPQVALTPPDIVLSNGTTWTEIDVSQTITAQVASNVSFTPAGNIAATNVQVAIQELDTEKLPLAGGTITGNLEIGTAGSLSFEGATGNAFETTIAVVDPTADRTITLPNETGTVITTGDTGTITSTMLLDGTILNEDINASAAIAYSKLATLTSANIVLGSSANVATSTAVTGDVTISNTGVTAIATGVIVNADINASAAIEGSKIVAATTSVAGTVQLSDSTSTTSSVLAATPTAVKAAFDQANTKASLSTAQTFTAAQRGAISALTDGATITADFAVANNFSVTLGGSRTLANPSNQTAGQSGCIWITQDGTGSRTLAYGSQWDFTGGTAPTLSTTAAAVDCLVYAVQSSTKITATLVTNLS